jgi:hypothetical protein
MPNLPKIVCYNRRRRQRMRPNSERKTKPTIPKKKKAIDSPRRQRDRNSSTRRQKLWNLEVCHEKRPSYADHVVTTMQLAKDIELNAASRARDDAVCE